MPLPLDSLNHIARSSPRPLALAAFYSRVLGLRPVRRPDLGFAGAWLGVPGDGRVLLHIIEAPAGAEGRAAPERPMAEGGDASRRPPEDPQGVAKGHHLAFRTERFDECKRMLGEMGVEYFEQTGVGRWEGGEDGGKSGDGWGETRQLFLFDPDGNGVEISELPRGQPPFVDATPGATSAEEASPTEDKRATRDCRWSRSDGDGRPGACST
ncbi:hypothetical protein DFJ74DRAFT_765817 [Hyaloraphidium curvatum]|nr:hypothetical protein DFJ74DRAFT_765817 [Hyaloraphidium curvatum]